MKAIRYDRFGGPDVLEVREVEVPPVGDDDVLIRVRAAAVNPLDYYFMRGTPYIGRAEFGLRRPKFGGLGAYMAGVVAAVGRNVTGFQPGNEVFGGGRGMLAEYVCLRQGEALLAKPADLSFVQAASVPSPDTPRSRLCATRGECGPDRRLS